MKLLIIAVIICTAIFAYGPAIVRALGGAS